MPKYHDSGTVCKAGIRACPLGVSDDDYIKASSPADFEEKLDAKMSAVTAHSNPRADLRKKIEESKNLSSITTAEWDSVLPEYHKGSMRLISMNELKVRLESMR